MERAERERSSAPSARSGVHTEAVAALAQASQQEAEREREKLLAEKDAALREKEEQVKHVTVWARVWEEGGSISGQGENVNMSGQNSRF